MGAISAILDIAILLFSTSLSFLFPLISAQACIPESLYPAPLVDLKNLYVNQFGDYIILDKPHFYVGLAWIHILFVWPLCIANIYGILSHRPWASTTTLAIGVAVTTSNAAVMSDILNSGKATEKLLQLYTPFAFFGLLATIRGFCSRSRRATAAASHGPSARKKRA